ncbi:hypothetical protein NQ315_010655 [Exocentrus adspersus]|uniref:Uncharacterized protein n=1 Tax=Exocentrus adspersus TaxID=1586481 RepID=A0AAV8W571_9CUCU|nr:hypothetical protein NQ315_010655 [Exocentrus adspersus]
MVSDDELLIDTAVAVTVKSKSKKRSRWTKNWLQKRRKYSHTNLLEELRLEPRDWLNYMRMDINTYEELLCLVAPLIKKNDTIMRPAITPHERLSATLRFLRCLTIYGVDNLEDKERKHSLYKEQLSREQRYLKRRLEQLSIHFAMSKRRSLSECSSSTISSNHSTTSFSSAPSPISESDI